MTDQEALWFNTPDTHSLCRGGSNGPAHPSQLYAIRKYVKPGMSFLDYGAGSGTTYEAINKELPDLNLNYHGLDIIKKNAEWCNEHFGTNVFHFNPDIHKIDEPDRSWDVVYSRHVVDHMKSFEDALDEHCRVAKDLVIVVLWVPFSNQDEHEIKNIDYRPSGGKLYPDEYTNSYSEKKVMEYLHNKIHEGWKLKELTKEVGVEVGGHDIVLVLQRS